MGQPLPVIVSMGGVNGAGRSSMHHSTARMLEDVLSAPRRAAMLASLRQLMGADAAADAEVLAGTLIRSLESHHFDPARVACNRRRAQTLTPPPARGLATAPRRGSRPGARADQR